MEELEIDCDSLAVDFDRTPAWPASLVGSITHTKNYAAAAVTYSRLAKSIGIDSEIVGAVSSELWEYMFTSEERDWLNSLHGSRPEFMATLLFSAKEAFYKCQYKLTHQWVDFNDIYVVTKTVNASSGTFTIYPVRERFPTLNSNISGLFPLPGRFLFHDDLVSTGMIIKGNDN